MFAPVVERARNDGLWVRGYVSMCFGDPWEGDVPVNQVVDDLKRLITARFPDAGFTVFEGEDPEGVYLRAVVDVDDSSDVMETVLDKLYELEVEQELPVYVVTSQPPERVAAKRKTRRNQPRPTLADGRL